MGTIAALAVSVISSKLLTDAQKKAGKAQAGAAREASELTQARFEDVRGRLDPFIDPGAGALQEQAALSGALGPEAQAAAFADFQEDPGTQFLREQGLRLIGTELGATGKLGSGDRLKALTEFSQGLALQDLDARFNRLGAVTGTGLTAASALGGVSTAASAGQSQALQAAGVATAGGILGRSEAINRGIQSAGSILSGIPFPTRGGFGGGTGLGVPGRQIGI